jgi:outer membrane protein
MEGYSVTKRAVILFVLATFSLISPVAAQNAIQFPRSLSLSQAALRAAAQAPVPSTASPAIPGQTGPRMPLTMEEAVALALAHNLDIAVARLNPSTFDLSLAGLRAVYNPTITSSVVQQSATSPSTNTLSGATGGTGITAGTQTFNGGLAQAMQWGGGSFTVALNNQRTTSTSQTVVYDPQYLPNWSGTYTQPLLRNFRIDSNREQLVITKLNQDISDIQVTATVTNTVANVRNAYWDYVFAIQSVDVAQRSLNLAGDLVKNNQTKVEIGTLAPIDVVQAQSQAAAQRQALVTAQGTARTAEITLKRLLVGGTSDPVWTSTIDPVDRPDFVAQNVDVNAAILRAQSTRTDVLQAKKNLLVNDETLKFLTDQTKPQADLVGRYGAQGIGGTFYQTSGSGINRVVTAVVPGGYGDALSTLFKRDFPTWSFTLNFSYPLGTSAQEAAIARAKIQGTQVDAQLRQIDLQVATDVSNAAVNVQNGAERVQAAQSARDLAQQQLDAENSKFNVGMSTNYNIVQAQRDLATAQNNELQAVLAYRKALVELDRVQQTGTGTGITIVGR